MGTQDCCEPSRPPCLTCRPAPPPSWLQAALAEALQDEGVLAAKMDGVVAILQRANQLPTNEEGEVELDLRCGCAAPCRPAPRSASHRPGAARYLSSAARRAVVVGCSPPARAVPLVAVPPGQARRPAPRRLALSSTSPCGLVLKRAAH